MASRLERFVIGLAGAAVAAAILFAPPRCGAADPDPFLAMNAQRASKEVQAPGFRLQTLEGRPVTLEDLKGKVVFFYFWRTW